jgi:hypothetical protein
MSYVIGGHGLHDRIHIAGKVREIYVAVRIDQHFAT